MEKKDYLKLATEYSIKMWNFDIVLYAGEEDGWHYFSCTREGRPKYSSMPVAIRVSSDGKEIERLGGDVRYHVISMADRLNSNVKD
ncbi:MAG: hypothetical protein HDS62_08400 [Bacteroidales bacterium]|nr:hypothetical protein [Bacteroidales bacterium]